MSTNYQAEKVKKLKKNNNKNKVNYSIRYVVMYYQSLRTENNSLIPRIALLGLSMSKLARPCVTMKKF